MQDFKKKILELPYYKVNEILHLIPSGWNIENAGHAPFVNWIIKKINPKIIVDLGVDYGYSSFIMALSCSDDGIVYAVDTWEKNLNPERCEDTYNPADNHLFVLSIKEKLKLDNLIIIKDYFDNFAHTWKSISKKIDLLHIDGIHTYESCKHDYETWQPFLEENAVILFHDTISFRDGVGKFFFDELNLPKINFEHNNGLGVASKNENIIFEIKEKFKI